MRKEDKSVTHVLTIGETTTTVDGGYHLKSIHETLSELLKEHADLCQKQFDKYFGKDTEYAKASEEIKGVAGKDPKEQTQEDLQKAGEFLTLRNKTFEAYNTDPETPKVKSTWKQENGEEAVLFDGDLFLVCGSVRDSLMDRGRILTEVSHQLFDIMRKSNLKMAAVLFEFDDDELQPGENNHALLSFGSAFRELEAKDVEVLDGLAQQFRDKTVPEIRQRLGIPEEPKILL